MYVKQFPTGGDRNFGYLVADESSNKALVIDPSFSPEKIVNSQKGRASRLSISLLLMITSTILTETRW